MEASQKPIGIFDSGVGGLSVYHELKKALPHERFVYLGDTARVPYGNKSQQTVLSYAIEDSHFLLQHSVKLIVIACNTATSFALEELQAELTVPVIGVIEAGVEAALQASLNNRIGIIGTEGTIQAEGYQNKIKNICPEAQCFSKATPLFVPLIEEHILQKEILYPVFDLYLKSLLEQNIDTLILGCTHYPLIKSQLDDYFKQSLILIDSAEVTSNQVKSLLKEQRLETTCDTIPVDQIYVTDAPQRVQKIASYFLGNHKLNVEKTSLSN